MHQFTRSIVIAAPPARVFDVMQDVERWHEWTPSITGIRRLGGGPFGVGSRAVVRQPKFPPALWTVTDLQPGRSFTWVSRAPGLRVTGRHVAEPDGAGTRATVGIDIEGLFAGPWARLTRAITERYLDFEAQGLKARCE
jgi:uncharacterized protein YndB with AHSA1/START domain